MEIKLEEAAEKIRAADAILIGAGAGMGVDSGLPDFRGDEGFWKAYPPYRHLGRSFVDMANPEWFAKDIQFAWGFYGHRRNLYRSTQPHEGFAILKKWADSKKHSCFVYTSNVDAQFQKAGFHPRSVVECHGSIEWNQCLVDCGSGPFRATAEDIRIDEQSMRAAEPLPHCPKCGKPARPNILMFGDWDWDNTMTSLQDRRFNDWHKEIEPGRLVIIECGAGTTIPSVRWFCESHAHHGNAMIRINPRESEIGKSHIGLAGGALEVLRALDGLI